MSNYIALIHKDESSGYGVSFPDFPGCVTVGDTLDDARKKAVEVLAFHIEGMTEDGDSIPLPSSLESIMRDADNRDGVAILVDGPQNLSKSVRVNVSLPEDLLARIDSFAANAGFSRSSFLTRAAIREIDREASGKSR